jgi:hypothetical protein
MTSTTVRATMSMADRIPFIFGPSHRAQQYSAARPEDEDLETLAMFDALLEREKDDHQALWYGLDPSREDDPEDEDEEEEEEPREHDYFSYDDDSD